MPLHERYVEIGKENWQNDLLVKMPLRLYIQPHSLQAAVFTAFEQTINPFNAMVSTFISTHKTPLETATKRVGQSAAEAREIARQMSQECVARRLRQVNRTITRLYDEALRPHGLTVNQLNILAVVISEKQIRPGQLGQSLGMEKSTVSRTVDRMVKKDWLKVAQGEDSRTQLLSATAKGRKLLLSVTPIWDDLQAGVLTDTGSGHNILQLLALDDESESTTESNTDEADIYPDEPIRADDFYL